MYWPYTFKEAANLGLDFFGAINVGLGKENAIRYTIHPMDFIKDHRFLGAAPEEKPLTFKEENKPLVTSSETVADTRPPANDIIETVVPMIENTPIPEVVKEPEVIKQQDPIIVT